LPDALGVDQIEGAPLKARGGDRWRGRHRLGGSNNPVVTYSRRFYGAVRRNQARDGTPRCALPETLGGGRGAKNED
jgi:hypothetical protein